MKYTFRKSVGLLLIGTGVFLLLLSVSWLLPTHAQDDADYIGARECNACHSELGVSHSDSRHALTLQEDFLADFSQGEEVRLIQFPDEAEPRPLSEDDIAFAVGSGRYVQRYLFEADRDEYKVLPVEWNILEQQWQPFGDAENWLDWNENCAGCHTTGLNPDRGRWEDDGVQCEACHGPGSIHAEVADDAGNNPSDRELEEIRASINPASDPQVCGQCHSAGTDTETGFPYPTVYRPGQNLQDGFTLVETADTVHWWRSGHAKQPNMQFNEWFNSAHATALASVQSSDNADETCLRCHSSDYNPDSADEVHLDAAQNGVTCQSCHNLHGETEFDFLLTDEPNQLCADCHSNEGLETIHHPTLEMFSGETLIAEIEGLPTAHFTAENGPECTTCHMPHLPVESAMRTSHTFTPVLPGVAEEGQTDTCTACHADLSTSYAQDFIEGSQEKTETRLQAIRAAVQANPQVAAWVVQAVDFVEGDSSAGVHNYAYTDTLLNAAENELNLIPTDVPIFLQSNATDPQECAECHSTEHQLWQNSIHANASLEPEFLEEYAKQGRPSYCFRCHASGYDTATGTYQFQGVVCTSCHTLQNGVEHPPAPVSVANDATVCATCHSGAHAPTYDEWLESDHFTAGVDCVDCHKAHNNGLRLDNVNATCGDCHDEALVDEVHMGEDLVCTNCHMTLRTLGSERTIPHTNHNLNIDPSVCAECHGNTHLLSVIDMQRSEEEVAEITTLKEDVDELEKAADENLYSGIVGGAIGAVLLLGLLFVIVRLGRMK